MHPGPRDTRIEQAEVFPSPYSRPRLKNLLTLTGMCILALSGVLVFSPCSFLRAADDPFTFSSSWGGTGLMEIPTARVMRENHWRIGISQVDPSRTYYGVISPLAGLEIDGRITEILDTSEETEVGDFEGYGNNKDKSVDFKYQFLSEGKYCPALALGIMDPSGTRLLASQYLVASKQIYPFDFTVGLGNGRFGKQPLERSGKGVEVELFSDPKQWWDDMQVFAGVQFAPSERFALMVEYAPIKYEKMSLYDVSTAEIHFDEPVPSKVNVGLRLKPLDWTEIDLSWQRGEQFGVNFALDFSIGEPLIPIYDAPYREEPAARMSPLEGRIATALEHSGFSNISVAVDGDDLWIEAGNDHWFFPTRAVGVVMRIVDETCPDTVNGVSITLTENRIPVSRFSATRSDIGEWRSERLTAGQLICLSRLETDVYENLQAPVTDRRYFKYGFMPSMQTFLNDPSGFFKARLGLQVWGSAHPWRGASLVAGVEGYPVNNISTTNEPLSIPVRSDIALYKEQDVALARLMADQVVKGPYGVYGRLSAGILELMYTGFDAEAAVPVLDGRFFLGVSGSAVKKRDPDDVLKLKEDDVKDWYTTAFGNARLNVPEYDAWLDVKAGRFLAGDNGARFTVSKFIKGVTMSVWYGVTDTSVFSDEDNRGYHDTGFMVTIPIRLFKGEDSRTSYWYSLSPWTRDVAQDISHYNNLFDLIGRNTKIGFKRDAGEMGE